MSRIFMRFFSSFLFIFISFCIFSISSDAITVKGRVVNDQEAPVADAGVWISQDRQPKSTKTDENGKFSFEGLLVQSTDLVVYKEGLSIAGSSGLLTQDADLLLTLHAIPGKIHLRVTDGDFKPVPGARVKAMVISDQFSFTPEDLVDMGFPSLRTDDGGELVIPFMPADGFAKIIIGHHDYADSSVAYLPVREKRQDVQIYPGVPVRGRVTFEGKGIAGARVLISQQGATGEQAFAEPITDSEGFYTARAPEGVYGLSVRHREYASPSPKEIAVKGPEDQVVDFELPVTRVLEGQVVLPDGKPASGTRITFRHDQSLLNESITDTDGRYSMRIGYGDGEMMVVPPKGLRTKDLPQIPVTLGETRHVTLSPIQLVNLPVISGRIEMPDQKPLEGRVLISAQDLKDPLLVLSDTEGRFHFQFDYQPEQNTVTFRAEHALRFLRRDFKVNLDQQGEVILTLEPFEPDLSERPPVAGRNDLRKLLKKEAPKIACAQWYNTQPVTLEGLKGKVVVLTLWGGFDNSPFGINRLGELRAISDLFQGVDDVFFLGVHDATSDPDEVARYVRQLDIRFPVGRDADPFVSFTNYEVSFIPQTLLIDKEGKVRYDQTEGRLLEMIKALRRK